MSNGHEDPLIVHYQIETLPRFVKAPYNSRSSFCLSNNIHGNTASHCESCIYKQNSASFRSSAVCTQTTNVPDKGYVIVRWRMISFAFAWLRHLSFYIKCHPLLCPVILIDVSFSCQSHPLNSIWHGVDK